MKKLIAAAAMVLSTTAVAQPDKDWWYERYSRGETDLRECQESARESNLGLWDGDPVEPWEWRRR